MLYLLTFQCAVLIPDLFIIAGCDNGFVHFDISSDCSNQVSSYHHLYCYTYNIEQFQHSKVLIKNCFDL